jgi:hypothetical protein
MQIVFSADQALAAATAVLNRDMIGSLSTTPCVEVIVAYARNDVVTVAI